MASYQPPDRFYLLTDETGYYYPDTTLLKAQIRAAEIMRDLHEETEVHTYILEKEVDNLLEDMAPSISKSFLYEENERLRSKLTRIEEEIEWLTKPISGWHEASMYELLTRLREIIK